MQNGHDVTNNAVRIIGTHWCCSSRQHRDSVAITKAARILRGAVAAVIALTSSLPAHAQEPDETKTEDYPQALQCLTLAVAYEAGYESLEGRQAVAEVVLNRLRSKVFQGSVCDVIFAGSTRRTGCQFSFTCDGSLSRRLPERIMMEARMVAEDALANRIPSRVPGATHYHANYVRPYWAPSLTRLTQIGAHIFYQMPGNHTVYGQINPGGTPSSRIAAARSIASQPAPSVFAPWGLAPDAPAVEKP